MKLIFAEQALDDYLHWQATDKTLLKRINRLIEETRAFGLLVQADE